MGLEEGETLRDELSVAVGVAESVAAALLETVQVTVPMPVLLCVAETDGEGGVVPLTEADVLTLCDLERVALQETEGVHVLL